MSIPDLRTRGSKVASAVAKPLYAIVWAVAIGTAIYGVLILERKYVDWMLGG